MADFDLLGDGLRKVLLAGIGALATGYEKSSELVDERADRGKAQNTEPKPRVAERVEEAKKAPAEAGDKAAAAADTSAADKPADEGKAE